MAPSTPHQRHAFTLIEVLIAAAIFAIGLIAVAAIFPTAIQLQKQTFEEIRGDEFSKTVRALVLQRGFDERLLADRAEATGTGSNPVTGIVTNINNIDSSTAVPRVVNNGRIVEPPTVFTAQRAVRGSDNPPLKAEFGEAQGWSMTDRSSGSLDLAIYTNGNGALGNFPPTDDNVSDPTFINGSFDYGGRNLFWSPVFIDYDENVANLDDKPAPDEDARNNRSWGVFVFVLRADPNSDYRRLEPASGSVRDIALNNDIDVPQDLTVDTPPQGVNPWFRVPGVFELNVTINVTSVGGVDRHEFLFVNGVNGANDPGNPIVRVGDTVLAENGLTYVVSDLLLGADPTLNSSVGVAVEGFIVDRTANPVSSIWVAHPGDSGESSLVRVIQLTDIPGTNNLIR